MSFAATGAGVGTGPLTTGRQISRMSHAPVGSDLFQPLDITGNPLPQISFDEESFFQYFGDFIDFFVLEGMDAAGGVYLGLIQHGTGNMPADAVNIR